MKPTNTNIKETERTVQDDYTRDMINNNNANQ
jgi:hypothetical protein